MRIATVLPALVIASSLVVAQIPNPGFEQWSAGDPVEWVTSNVSGVYSTVTQNSAGHSGTSSARGVVVMFATAVIQPVLQSGPGGRGSVIAFKPASVKGFYQYTPVVSSGDRFAVNVVLTKGGVDGIHVATAAAGIATPTSGWTEFDVPFVYHTSDAPDTIIAQFQIVGPGTGPQAIPHVGSVFLLDDLSLSGSTAVDAAISTPLSYELEQNHPNPFNPSTSVRFTLGARSVVTLGVYDALGREVARLAQGELPQGRHVRTWNAPTTPSGMYFYRLEAVSLEGSGESFIQTRKMVLAK